MSFSNDVKTGFFFSYQSEQSLNRAVVNIHNSLSLMASPYYDSTSNAKALGHPFFQATQLVRDVGRFVYGSFVLAGALGTGNFSAAGKVSFGMFLLVGAATLEIFNTAIAVLSLATRLVASMFNLGYVSNSVPLLDAHLNDAEISELHAEKQSNDQIEHRSVFALV